MNFKSLVAISFLFLFTSTLVAQELSSTSEDSYSSNSYIPVAGDNFSFGYGDNLSVNFSYYIAEGSDITTLFLHKGFSKLFSLTIGTANSDVLNPELIYITPEFSFDLSDKATLGLKLKCLFPDDVSNYFFIPTASISLGTPLKNITFGYGPAFGDGEFYSTILLDAVYANASFQIGGRYPITNTIGLYSKNDIITEDGISYLSKTGVEYRKSSFSLHVLLFYTRINFGGFTGTSTNYILGASKLF